MSKSMYRPHIQGLYTYFIHRIESDLKVINEERMAENELPLTLDATHIDEIAQELVNYIVDTEEFQDEVTSHIMDKAEI